MRGERLAGAAEWARSRRLSWPLLAAAFGVGGAAWLWNHQGVPWELASGDARAYADMARRIAHGEGFTAGLIWPAELWLGAGEDHPAVRFPPGWPLLLAGGFAVFGAGAAAAHAVVGFVFAALATGATALGTRLAGRGAGALAGIAVVTSPELRLVSLDPVSETAFAATLMLCFLLCARREPPLLAIGAACGFAYLVRYNGATVLPALLAALWLRGVGVRRLALCVAGFLLVATPWWLRNLAIAGDPFYSALNLNLYVAPGPTPGDGLFYQPEPDLASPAAMDPLRKVAMQLPVVLASLPYASANAAALLGVALACLRREALSLGFALFAGANLLVVAAALVLGRYFAPLLAVMLVLGVAGWVRFGGRLRAPALALLLLAPWLPSFPAPLPDLQLFAAQVERFRAGLEPLPPPDPRLAACLEGAAERPLLLAQDASRFVWQHDVVGISAPRQAANVAAILDAFPVDYVQLPEARSVPPGRLVPAPACGEHWYVPRARPGIRQPAVSAPGVSAPG